MSAKHNVCDWFKITFPRGFRLPVKSEKKNKVCFQLCLVHFYPDSFLLQSPKGKHIFPPAPCKVLKTPPKDLGLMHQPFHQPDKSPLHQFQRRRSWKLRSRADLWVGVVVDETSKKYARVCEEVQAKSCVHWKGKSQLSARQPHRGITWGGFCKWEPFPGGLRSL